MLPDTTMEKDSPPKKTLTMGFDIHFICILKCTLCFSAFLSNAPAPEGHLSPTSKTPAAWCHRKSQIQVPQKTTCLMRPSPAFRMDSQWFWRLYCTTASKTAMNFHILLHWNQPLLSKDFLPHPWLCKNHAIEEHWVSDVDLQTSIISLCNKKNPLLSRL